MRIVERGYDTVNFYWPGAANGLSSRPQPWVYSWNAWEADGRCDVNDGFIHPAFPSTPPQTAQPTGAPVNPYDQSHPPAMSAGCHATTGT